MSATIQIDKLSTNTLHCSLPNNVTLIKTDSKSFALLHLPDVKDSYDAGMSNIFVVSFFLSISSSVRNVNEFIF